MLFQTSIFLSFLFSRAIFTSGVNFLGVSLLDDENSTQVSTNILVSLPPENPPVPEIMPVLSLMEPSLISIAWMEIPPYIFHEKSSSKGNKSEPFVNSAGPVNESRNERGRRHSDQEVPRDNTIFKGIFHEVVSKALRICGKVPEKNVVYEKPAQDLQKLDKTIVEKTADIAMPVHGDQDGKYGGYNYVEVLSSPGAVLIVNKQQLLEQSRKLVLQAMKKTWPVFVLTLLLTGLAGLAVWCLDTSENSKQFPRSFTRGVADGIWWSFVSMTTVGYGDKVPKSLFAKLFGVMWILMGLVLCSFFTATFTSALTTSSIKQPADSLLGMKVAVITDSHAYDVAMRHAANLKAYPGFYEMYEAFTRGGEVDGILADFYSASYYLEKLNDPRLVVSKFFTDQRSVGFVIGDRNFKVFHQWECLKDLFKYRQRDVQKIILGHINSFHTQTLNRKLTDEDTDVIVSLLDGDSHWFKNTFFALSVVFSFILIVGFSFEYVSTKCILQKRPLERKCAVIGKIDLKVELPPCKPNR